MKKSISVVAIATVLCISLLTGCGSNQSTEQMSTSENLSSVPVSTTSDTTTNYDTVLSLCTDGYQDLSVKDFNAAVKMKIEGSKDFLNTVNEYMDILTPEDRNYQFVYETLNYSVNEIISPQLGESIVFLQPLMKMDNGTEKEGLDGEIVYDYDFAFTTGYSVEYKINDDANLTVQERDQLLQKYQNELQNTISNMSNEELQAGDIRKTLQSIVDDLAKKFSTTALTFENAKIQHIEIHVGGLEYQK